MGAELTKEKTEQASGNSGFDSGWFGFLHEKTP